jgi:hypothetical protein
MNNRLTKHLTLHASKPTTQIPRGISMDTDVYSYLRSHATELGSRILDTYPPLQSTKDPVAPRIATLLRKALPAQALAITGTAKYLCTAKSARIVAECGAGKTYMALGTIYVLADGRPSATLVMCPSHITHKWAREALLTVPRARTFLIEDMRNGGDPKKPHGICEVKLRKGRIVYEGHAPVARRVAAHGPQGVAQALLSTRVFHYRQGQGQNWATTGSTSTSKPNPARTSAA